MIKNHDVESMSVDLAGGRGAQTISPAMRRKQKTSRHEND